MGQMEIHVNGTWIKMGKNRLEAFSDGVLAIIITIMVLELKAPHGASVAVLIPLVPALSTYVLSFVYLGIYWNNHHHMLHVTAKVTGGVLWANAAPATSAAEMASATVIDLRIKRLQPRFGDVLFGIREYRRQLNPPSQRGVEKLPENVGMICPLWLKAHGRGRVPGYKWRTARKFISERWIG